MRASLDAFATMTCIYRRGGLRRGGLKHDGLTDRLICLLPKLNCLCFCCLVAWLIMNQLVACLIVSLCVWLLALGYMLARLHIYIYIFPVYVLECVPL